MNNTVSERRVLREIARGQLLMGTCNEDAQMLHTMQKLIDLCLIARFTMLFTVFTRLNTKFFLSPRTHLIGHTRRATKLLKMVDRFKEFENTRRARYLRKLKSETTHGP